MGNVVVPDAPTRARSSCLYTSPPCNHPVTMAMAMTSGACTALWCKRYTARPGSEAADEARGLSVTLEGSSVQGHQGWGPQTVWRQEVERASKC
jgi:hypothetical protein